VRKTLVYKIEIFGKPLFHSFLFHTVDFWGVLYFLDSGFAHCIKINGAGCPAVSSSQ
jgi:hypothetical protein